MAKEVLVIGLAKSGHAGIKLLQAQGYQVSVTINNSLSEQDKDLLNDVEVYENGHPLSLLDKDWEFILKNPGIPYKIPFVQAALEKGFKIISEIELGYLYSSNHVLALTGTNGKTSTTSLIYDIFKEYYHNVYCAGNIGTPYSEVVLKHSKDNYMILELSSFQLMGTIKFKPHVACILNLAPDHLDYMESLDAYYKSKLLIYQNQTNDDYFLLNKDDQLLNEYVKDINAHIITFSCLDKADIYLKDNWIYYDDTAFIDTSLIKLRGLHNVYNVMVAIGYSMLYQIPIEVIRKVVYSFNGVEYRLQQVTGLYNTYFNDSKSTSPEACITALKSFNDEDLILIVGGYDKGLAFNELEDLINEMPNVSKVLTYGQIKDIFKDHLKTDVIEFDDLASVVNYIHQNIKDKIILFSCATSSYDQYKNYEERGAHFNKLIRGD